MINSEVGQNLTKLQPQQIESDVRKFSIVGTSEDHAEPRRLAEKMGLEVDGLNEGTMTITFIGQEQFDKFLDELLKKNPQQINPNLPE